MDRYARVKPSAAFTPGCYVLCKRPRTGPFCVRSAGPYIVLGEEGDNLKLMAIASGKVVVESKTNCR
jgi:hypothetical protein